MKNWHSTIGGAFAASGAMMVGIGVVPQLGGTPNKLLTWIALLGFVFNVVGVFLAHLFAADARTVTELGKQMREVPAAINSGDTQYLSNRIIAEDSKNNPTPEAAEKKDK